MKRLFVLAAVVLLVACATKKNEQAFLDEVGTQTKEQIMARGDDLAKKKKWDQARKYYTFLSDTYPNDQLGRRAALKVADTFFAVGDTEGLTEAQLRYKDFSNRFPNDPNRAYALLKLAQCGIKQGRGPLRDLAPVREAKDSLKLLLQLFPTSQYAKEAGVLLSKCLEDLAQHELLIAKYYANVEKWVGARQRLDYLMENYPETAAAKAAKPLMQMVESHLGGFGSPTPAPTPAARPPA